MRRPRGYGSLAPSTFARENTSEGLAPDMEPGLLVGSGPMRPARPAEMGSLFPDDLRASLLRHDEVVHLNDIGAFGFLGNSNASVREIQDTWRQLCLIDGQDDGTQGFTDPRTEWWDGRMLPFGSDGVGNHLVVDSVKRDVGGTDHEGIMSSRPEGHGSARTTPC
ncbi:hypothetical protein [Nonomuraea roseola]|uniref:Uncharacterized protein n=1 Tax=Nonomuraea roseola TaxID=46179 RepID=A0ABV5Q177_9ACTN